ncbi:MAG: hypothetical protein V4649_08425 [Bacteroidota bacterium]
MSIKHLFIPILLFVALGARAQRPTPGSDTVLKGSTIEVIQAYTPKVKQSPKPEWIPQLPPVDTNRPAISFEVPQQTLYFPYNSLPLNPLELGRAPFVLPFPNYIKAGGGNMSTIFVDAGIGGIYGKNYESAIHLHHLSQKGNIVNQQSSLSGLEADGMLHKAKTDWHGALIAQRNQYKYYGYDHQLHNYNEDTVNQVYTTIRGIIDLKNRTDSNGSRFTYHPSVNGSYYGAKLNTSEVSFGFDAPFNYMVDSSLDLQIAVRGAYSNFNNDTQAISNSVTGAWPGLSLHGEHMAGHALVGLVLGMDGSGYILPDIAGEYKAGGNKFFISAGWQASLRRNTYEELTTENPYMRNIYTVLQTRRDEVYGQFRARGGDHFTYSGRISWWSFADLATFLNNNGDQKEFDVLYQDVKAISFKAAARYTVADRWSVGGSADFYSYYNISTRFAGPSQYVWHEPAMRIKADFTITPVKKLTCNAYLSILGGIQARDVPGNVVDLPTIFDAGVSAEYQLIPRLSVFAQINNLFNNKYQRWYGYDVYGLNIYGGLRLKF